MLLSWFGPLFLGFKVLCAWSHLDLIIFWRIKPFADWFLCHDRSSAVTTGLLAANQINQTCFLRIRVSICFWVPTMPSPLNFSTHEIRWSDSLHYKINWPYVSFWVQSSWKFRLSLHSTPLDFCVMCRRPHPSIFNKPRGIYKTTLN